MEAVECGAASLGMILAYHGHHAPLAELRRACRIGRDGCSAATIIQAAATYHLEAEAVQVDLEELDQLPLPAILHWGFCHFLVLESVGTRSVYVVDPAAGRTKVHWDELDRSFTGVALVFNPDESFTPRAEKRPSLAKYQDLLKSLLPVLGLILAFMVMLEFIGMVFPMANQFLLDKVIIPRQEAWLIGLALALGGAWLSKTLMNLGRSWVVQGLQVHMDSQLMHRFMTHLFHLPLAFFLQRRSGDVLQRATSLSSVRNLFTEKSVSALLDGFLLLGYATLMVAMEPVLGVLILLLALVRVGMTLWLKGFFQQIMSAELAAVGREQSALMEAVSALETVKASQAEDRMVERWNTRTVERINIGLGRRRLELVSSAGMALFQAGSLALITWVGGLAVVEERLTLGVYAAFMALQGMVALPLENLISAYGQLQYLGTHLRRLDDILESPLESGGKVDPGRLRGEIEVVDVAFRYEGGASRVVDGVSVHIRPGEKIALVGPSGAGKSTLARLLLGMHLPETGTIRFDGVDLRELDLHRLRNQVGVVLQDTFLFDDTARANLCLNDPNLATDQLRSAVEAACLWDVLMALPKGLDTPLGPNGSRLSGGQRQRLSLARALAHNPAILLLDEATSALDLETEARLHANLATMGCTRIVIAHRLATVKDADRILVMREGKIVQVGTFAQLKDEDGVFAQLVQAMEGNRDA